VNAGTLDNIDLHLVETIDDAANLKRWASQHRSTLAVDTETCGLEWWHEPVRLVILADTETGWAIPWERWAGVAHELLGAYRGRIVFHNAKFDLHVLAAAGIHVSAAQVDDTLTAAHLLDPAGRHGLKYLAARTFGPEATAGEQMLKERMAEHRWTWATIPYNEPAYWIYGALDGVLTARLWDLYRPTIETTFRNVYELEIATLDVLFRMEQRGARVDLEYVRDKSAALEKYEHDLREWAARVYMVNPTSSRDVAARLILDGIELTEKTDTGSWRLDDGILAGVDHPLAEAVRKIRETSKIRRTYFEAIEAKAHGDRVHPSIRPLGARTGRMSISDPPLQQLPRGTIVRDAFVASEGCALVSADYDQIELRLLAHFAREAGMIDAIRSGVDLHSNTARLVFGDEFTKEHRQIAKGLNFAKVYGSGIDGFAKVAGIDYTTAETILADYDHAFPGVVEFMRTVERVARDRRRTTGAAYLTAPSGRRQPVDDGAYYRGVNYLIQGTAADVLKRALVDLDAAGLGDYLVLPVHDEVIADVPANEAANIAHEIETVMSDPDTFAVPLTASADVMASRWGDKYR
jgi:DNA polymerase-1